MARDSCSWVSENRKYAWSFDGIDRALQQKAVRCLIAVDARVMPGGHRSRAERPGAIGQRGELQIAVAMRAGQRRTPGGVLLHEVRHDLLVELPLEVQDVVRDIDRRRDAPRIVQVVDRAAAPERPAVLALTRGVVQLHRQTDDVVALLGEQGRGD